MGKRKTAKRRAKVTAEVETITRQMAHDWMNRTKTANRKISPGHVAWLADQIDRGQFLLTGEPIILDAKGNVLDGQHRLKAVLLCRKPIRAVVVRGIGPDAFKAMGTGKTRNLADVLGMAGYHYGMSLGSALGWLYLYRQGNMLSSPRSEGLNGETALKLIKREPGIYDSVQLKSKGSAWKELRMISGQATFHYLYGRECAKTNKEFFDKVLFGGRMARGHPARRLREYMQARIGEPASEPQRVILAKTVIAARAFFEAEDCPPLRWSHKTEDFPPLLTDHASMGERAA